jgi:ketosteroid isomerase-like protein
MSTEDEVRQASEQFYAAVNRFVNGDAGPMLQVWSKTPEVTTMHPIGGLEVGWEQVRARWEQGAQLFSSGYVTLRDPLIQASDDLAYETGTEVGQVTVAGQPTSLEYRVTNVYRREAGGWKIVHHHSDLNPADQELYRRSQSSAGPTRS